MIAAHPWEKRHPPCSQVDSGEIVKTILLVNSCTIANALSSSSGAHGSTRILSEGHDMTAQPETATVVEWIGDRPRDPGPETPPELAELTAAGAGAAAGT